MIGTGVPTIGSVAFTKDNVQLDNGDGTVPARSAAQGTVGGTNPLGDNIPLSYTCGVAHVPLPGDPKVLATFGDFIRWGRPPKKTKPCDAKGTVFELSTLTDAPTGTRSLLRAQRRGAPPATLRALTKALAKPGLDLLPLDTKTVVITNAIAPRTVTLPADELFVTVRSLSGNHTGRARTFGRSTDGSRSAPTALAARS